MSLQTPMTDTAHRPDAPRDDEESPGGRDAATVSRRAFLGTVGVATATVTVLTVGQSFGPLRATNAFGPRDGKGPEGLPVNNGAAGAQVEQLAQDPGWQLSLTSGGRTLSWSRADLLGLPQTAVVLPIACVEGWSVAAHWRGVRLRELIAHLGAPATAHIRLTSLQPQGSYRITDMGPEFAHHRDTLVALELNGQTLTLDHGYPARIIAPNRPGVLQTKWLSKVEVLA